ncbi:MAG: hypothetical protein ABIG68_08300, partial [Acidobacteriota bacterium]
MTASKVAEYLETCTGPIEGNAAGLYSVRRVGSASYPVRPAGPAPLQPGSFQQDGFRQAAKALPDTPPARAWPSISQV